MLRRLFPVALVVGASCARPAPLPGPTIASPSDRVVLVGDDGTTYRTTVAPNAKFSVEAAPDRVLAATRAAYDDLGIPIAVADPTTGQVTSNTFSKTSALGKTAISTYLECGRAMIGPIADNYRVYMTVTSVVRPNGKGGSELETAFTAYARNMEGTSGDRVACGTTGQLEERIRRDVVGKVAATSR
jgi:hypothetical protein